MYVYTSEYFIDFFMGASRHYELLCNRVIERIEKCSYVFQGFKFQIDLDNGAVDINIRK